MNKPALSSQPTLPVVTPTEMVLQRSHGVAVPLGPLERKVVTHIDGVRTIAEIAPIVGLSPTETARLAARLVQLGAVTMKPGSVADAEVDAGWDGQGDMSEKDALLARRTIRAR